MLYGIYMNRYTDGGPNTSGVQILHDTPTSLIHFVQLHIQENMDVGALHVIDLFQVFLWQS